MKQLLVFIPFLFLSLLCEAQQFKAGAHLALNGAQLDGDGLSGYNKLGVYTGLWVSRTFSENWSWQFEISYSMKGSRRIVDSATFDAGPWLRLTMHYIDIPVLLRYQYTDRVCFEAGLSGNYLLSFQYQDPRNNLLNADFTRVELSMLGGATYKLNENWMVLARANYSVFSVDPLGSRVPFFALLQQGSFNNWLTLGMRYTFNRESL